MLSVNFGYVSSVAEGFTESVDYPAIHDFDIDDVGPAYRALVGRLASLIRVKHDWIGRHFTITNGLDLDLDLIDIRICPVQPLHANIITVLSPPFKLRFPMLPVTKHLKKGLRHEIKEIMIIY